MTLSLDARQRAMLAAMGVRVWMPAATHPTAPAAPVKLVTPAAPVETTAPSIVLKALPAGLADMDWPALEQAAASCQACGLCETRQRSMFAFGNPLTTPARTDWLIITDPPSAEEESAGELFLHAEGELLQGMLQALGLSRQAANAHAHVTIVPVLKCRVPETRNPLPEELQPCQSYLERQVKLLQPQVIVAMGRWAVQSVLSATSAEIAALPLGKQRSQVHRFADTPLVVTYHPKSLLHAPKDKAKAWDDLCLAHSLTRRPQH
jgi:DNA polymerase